MMDILIVLFWFLGMVLFAASQMFFLRHVPRYHSVQWLGKITLGIAFFTSFTSFVFSMYKQLRGVEAIFIAIVVGVLIIGSISAYILSIFSYMESSITLRFFSIIGKSGKEGIEYTQLIKKYGVKEIVDRRIERFLSSKVMRFNGKKYLYVERDSIFQIRDRLTQWYRAFFA